MIQKYVYFKKRSSADIDNSLHLWTWIQKEYDTEWRNIKEYDFLPLISGSK